jgi:hypothetical protein
MNRMPCRWILQRLPLVSGGDLRGADLRAVEHHVRDCPSCRARLADHERSLQVLQAAAYDAGAEPVAKPSLWPGLAQRIREARREPVLRLSAHWGRVAGRLAAAASLLVMLTGAGFCVWKYTPYRIVVKPPSIRLTRLPRPVVHPPSARTGSLHADQTHVDDSRAEAAEGELARAHESTTHGTSLPTVPTN